jgi:hypothetical protein
MNLLFQISSLYLPEFIKKKELMNLFRITAFAFDRSTPSIAGLSYEQCLITFAQFTQTEADYLKAAGKELQPIQATLYEGACKLGARFRKRFGVTTTRDVMTASKFLYHLLGIHFDGTEQGTATISRCFFSRYYSPATCKVISSLDAGLLAGLSAGGKFSFSERITEGYDCCKAQLQLNDRMP